MAGPKILVGARLVVYINHQPFGLVSDWKLNVSTPSNEIGGIDSVDLFELAPTISRVGGTFTIWRLAGDGGLQGAGLGTHSSALARGKYFSMHILDRVTDTTFFSCNKCRSEGESWSVGKPMVSGQISWKGLKWQNEVPNSLPPRR